MSTPFLSEIKIISFNFAPRGWAFCNGQLLPINQNQALFALLGTTYGGNGQTNFALPNLQSRIPFHTGGGLSLGQTGGEEAHTLNLSELPAHTHSAQGNSAQATAVPVSGNVWAGNAFSSFSTGAPNGTMDPSTVTSVGGSQSHENMPPFLVLNFVVALQGIFPSQN